MKRRFSALLLITLLFDGATALSGVAQQRGTPTSQRSVTGLYLIADMGNKAALQELRDLAEKGNAEAQLRLGRLYACCGRGVPENAVEAAQWYRKAADQGDPTAQEELGTRYRYGQGVPKDELEAVKWYRKAADQGIASAQVYLGILYQFGSPVVPKDLVQAYMWFNLAAAQPAVLSPARGQRDLIEKEMTRDQIAEAQRLSREWKPAQAK